MRDTLDRSTSVLGLAGRVLAATAILLIGAPLACVGVHHVTHPAPLGRSAEAMLRQIDTALPLGTHADTAKAFFAAHGVSVDEYSPAEARGFLGGDSLLAGGPVLIAVQPAVTRDLYVYNGHIRLYFSADRGLAGRTARLSAVSPL